MGTRSTGGTAGNKGIYVHGNVEENVIYGNDADYMNLNSARGNIVMNNTGAEIDVLGVSGTDEATGNVLIGNVITGTGTDDELGLFDGASGNVVVNNTASRLWVAKGSNDNDLEGNVVDNEIYVSSDVTGNIIRREDRRCRARV